MQTRESFARGNEKGDNFFLDVLMVIFWWPILLLKVLLDKTEEVNMPCSILALAAFSFMACLDETLILYTVGYLLLGTLTVKKNFWT